MMHNVGLYNTGASNLHVRRQVCADVYVVVSPQVCADVYIVISETQYMKSINERCYLSSIYSEVWENILTKQICKYLQKN